MKKQRKGFTLVELVIVIAILGILAAYAVPKYQGLVEQARSAEARAQLGTFRSALGIYYAQHHGQYPYPSESGPEDAGLFAEGKFPTAEITKGGQLVSNNWVAFVELSYPDHTKITQQDVESPNPSEAAWIYGATSDKTIADVRLNSTDIDPASVNPSNPSGTAWYQY